MSVRSRSSRCMRPRVCHVVGAVAKRRRRVARPTRCSRRRPGRHPRVQHRRYLGRLSLDDGCVRFSSSRSSTTPRSSRRASSTPCSATRVPRPPRPRSQGDNVTVSALLTEERGRPLPGVSGRTGRAGRRFAGLKSSCRSCSDRERVPGSTCRRGCRAAPRPPSRSGGAASSTRSRGRARAPPA